MVIIIFHFYYILLEIFYLIDSAVEKAKFTLSDKYQAYIYFLKFTLHRIYENTGQ